MKAGNGSSSALQKERSSTMSRRLSPRSTLLTKDCVSPRRSASSACVKRAFPLALRNWLRRIRYSLENSDFCKTPRSLGYADEDGIVPFGIVQNRLGLVVPTLDSFGGIWNVRAASSRRAILLLTARRRCNVCFTLEYFPYRDLHAASPPT